MAQRPITHDFEMRPLLGRQACQRGQQITHAAIFAQGAGKKQPPVMRAGDIGFELFFIDTGADVDHARTLVMRADGVPFLNGTGDGEFGMFEVHSHNQAAVLEAGEVVLSRLGMKVEDRIKPQIASIQVITRVDPYQAQLLNRFRRGSMIVPGETMLVLECAPAAYINFACNEAEKKASIKIIHVSSVGRFGRMWLSGSEAEIITARDAAVKALESLEGKAG